MAEYCESPNIKQEPQSNSSTECVSSTPTQQNIFSYVLNRDKAFKKIIDAANREEHADFQFHSNRLVIHLSAAAYGTMCKAMKNYYENSQFEVLLKEKMDQEEIVTEWLLSIKNPENLKESLRISMYHTTSRILVNGSMYPKFVAEHLDQIRQSLPNSEEMVEVNNDIKSKCAKFLNDQKTQRKSNSKRTPLKALDTSEEGDVVRPEWQDALPFTETPNKNPKIPGEGPAEWPETVPFQETPNKKIQIPEEGLSEWPDAVPFTETPNKKPNIFEASTPVSDVTPDSKANIPVTETMSNAGITTEEGEKLNTPSKQPNDRGIGSDTTPSSKTHSDTPNTTPSAKVSPTCGRGSMQQEHEMAIQSKYTFLTQELCPLPLADYLYQEFIFDPETHERITTNKDGRIAGMRILLKALLNSGKSAFPKFLDGLRHTGYDHVADILTGIESV